MRPPHTLPSSTVYTVGANLPWALLRLVANGDPSLPGLDAESYGLPTGDSSLGDATNREWRRLRAAWSDFRGALAGLSADEDASPVTRERWLRPLLAALGYEQLAAAAPVEIAGKSYPVSHACGGVPLHLVGCGIDLDRRVSGGASSAAASPHGLVQALLNRMDGRPWALLSNGFRLRLLRREDSSLSRPSYAEFHLQAMMLRHADAGFALLWRLCHRSRLECRGDAPCLLERWSLEATASARRGLERLRGGIEEAVRWLAAGRMAPGADPALRARLHSGALSPQTFFRQLLRTVYHALLRRTLAEASDALPLSGDPPRPRAGSEPGLPDSQQTAADPLSHEPTARELSDAVLRFSLAGQGPVSSASTAGKGGRQGDPGRPGPGYAVRGSMDVRDLGPLELGSIYEGLLDLRATLDPESGALALTHGGEERGATGAHYTAGTTLRQVLDFALEPAIERCLAAKDPAKALLGLRVLDPACGAGHLLVAAANRLARRLASVRTGEEAPAPAAHRAALREVVAHSIFGLDANPMAVELCKSALRLETLGPGEPGFRLVRRIVCADFLVGVPVGATVERSECRTPKPRRLAKPAAGVTWPAHVPDMAFCAAKGEDRERAIQLRRLNRRQRTAGEGAGLASGTSPLPPSNGAAGHARLLADAWCAAFFWPIAADGAAPPTDGTFQRLKTSPDALDPGTRRRIGAIARQRCFFHPELDFPEVFSGERPGFDVVIGNPPYLGGLKISRHYGGRYVNFLKANAPEAGGMTDLSAYFFRRAYPLLCEGGHLGFLATNTIAQGDTRRAALEPIVSSWGGAIVDAVRSTRWDGDAKLEVSILHLVRGSWSGRRTLDGREVATITPFLDDGTSGDGAGVALRENRGLAFQGSIVLGEGFVLADGEARRLLRSDPRNADVVLPYLSGHDLNRRPNRSAGRWVLQFDERTESEARSYPQAWSLVEARVKPVRMGKDVAKYPRMVREWWKHWNNRRELVDAIRGLPRVVVTARVSPTQAFVFARGRMVFHEKVVVFATASAGACAVLGSAAHRAWARRYTSTLGGITTLNYAPSDCFESFPLPRPSARQRERLETLGEETQDLVGSSCERRRLGLTKLYHLFHDPRTESDASPVRGSAPPFEDVRRLRAHSQALDVLVLEAYGWNDLDLRHDFYFGGDAGAEVAAGQSRFTSHPLARAQLLRRLLALNRQRAAEEAALLAAGGTVPSAFAAFDLPQAP
ncbi:MAG: hypothetical protein HYZ53_23870 [Planctomycetes bacterium]|nr:hypothetical protein [Planctomycetota bacterium]